MQKIVKSCSGMGVMGEREKLRALAGIYEFLSCPTLNTIWNECNLHFSSPMKKLFPPSWTYLFCPGLADGS